MMAREKFADRHPCVTIDIPHNYRGGDKRTLCVTYSRLPLDGDHPAMPTGRIGAVWINGINGYEKLVNDDMRDSCVTLSKDLQNGDTLERLSKSMMRDGRGKAHGWMGSAIDALKREPVDA